MNSLSALFRIILFLSKSIGSLIYDRIIVSGKREVGFFHEEIYINLYLTPYTTINFIKLKDLV